jgi:hypothetical protein
VLGQRMGINRHQKCSQAGADEALDLLRADTESVAPGRTAPGLPNAYA